MRRFANILAILVGLAFIISGAVAWGMVSSQLKDENITVPDDAPWSQGEIVNGPIDAFAQAEIIKEHALHSSEGMTYAELGKKVNEAKDAGDTAGAEKFQQMRNTVMNGSFLRASLFTSVLAYGVSAMAIATGLVMALKALADMLRDKNRVDTDHRRDGHVVDTNRTTYVTDTRRDGNGEAVAATAAR